MFKKQNLVDILKGMRREALITLEQYKEMVEKVQESSDIIRQAFQEG